MANRNINLHSQSDRLIHMNIGDDSPATFLFGKSHIHRENAVKNEDDVSSFHTPERQIKYYSECTPVLGDLNQLKYSPGELCQSNNINCPNKLSKYNENTSEIHDANVQCNLQYSSISTKSFTRKVNLQNNNRYDNISDYFKENIDSNVKIRTCKSQDENDTKTVATPTLSLPASQISSNYRIFFSEESIPIQCTDNDIFPIIIIQNDDYPNLSQISDKSVNIMKDNIKPCDLFSIKTKSSQSTYITGENEQYFETISLNGQIKTNINMTKTHPNDIGNESEDVFHLNSLSTSLPSTTSLFTSHSTEKCWLQMNAEDFDAVQFNRTPLTPEETSPIYSEKPEAEEDLSLGFRSETISSVLNAKLISTNLIIPSDCNSIITPNIFNEHSDNNIPLLSDVSCEYKSQEQKARCAPKMITEDENFSYSSYTEVNMNIIKKSILRNIEFLERHY